MAGSGRSAGDLMFLDPSSRKDLGRYMTLAQVGMEIVAPGVLGLLLDYHFDWLPWGVTIGMGLGLAGGLVHLVRLSNQSDDPPSGGTASSSGAPPPRSPGPPEESEPR